MKLIDQRRTGLQSGHEGIAPVVYDVSRATVPVLESLQAAGATAEPLPDGGYRITLGDTMPAGIVAVHVQGGGLPPGIGLRRAVEPEYPIEYPDSWAQVDWTPCPRCAAPVVWYEANYAPGYRVCTRPPHHHAIAR